MYNINKLFVDSETVRDLGEFLNGLYSLLSHDRRYTYSGYISELGDVFMSLCEQEKILNGFILSERFLWEYLTLAIVKGYNRINNLNKYADYVASDELKKLLFDIINNVYIKNGLNEMLIDSGITWDLKRKRI